jgi:hypothetical protein
VSETTVPAALRRFVRERAALRCEYCLLAEQDAFFPHEPDHVIALKHRGVTDASNLALACLDCNRFKGSDIASLDPQTGVLTPLFDPRSQSWASHFGATKGRIVPTTPTGRVTVFLLRMNLAARVDVRDELTSLGRWPAPGG